VAVQKQPQSLQNSALIETYQPNMDDYQSSELPSGSYEPTHPQDQFEDAHRLHSAQILEHVFPTGSHIQSELRDETHDYRRY
jgi:hypothetical protein